MTDNEIIKALECCNLQQNGICTECPLRYSGDWWVCSEIILKNALDLINRQKSEIARLQKTQDDIDNFARDLCKERLLKGKAIADFEDLQEYIRKEKSEAIREFAEKLKERNEDFCVDKSDMAFVVDKNVKEMTEG